MKWMSNSSSAGSGPLPAKNGILNRAPLVIDNCLATRSRNRQGRPLVGGKAPGEADGQRFGVEQHAWRGLVASSPFMQPLRHVSG